VQKRSCQPMFFRSRSAFKLLEMANRYDFLLPKDINVVVDLGAAPGGWSQVMAGKFGWSSDDAEEKGGSISEDSETLWSDSSLPPEKSPHSGKMGRGTIIAVDLANILPIPGVQTVKGNFLEENTVQIIRGLLFNANNEQPKVDVILSDMGANRSGNQVHDSQSSLEICEAVFEFAKGNLRTADEVGRPKGGVLLMKFFIHPLLDKFRKEKLQPNFRKTFLYQATFQSYRCILSMPRMESFSMKIGAVTSSDLQRYKCSTQVTTYHSKSSTSSMRALRLSSDDVTP